MTRCTTLSLFPLLGLSLAIACSDGVAPADVASASAHQSLAHALPNTGFGFNGTAAGFPTGSVRLTGGGSFNAATASNTVPPPTPTFVSASGAFDCVSQVSQGPLAGCASGAGVRWDTEQLLASTGFKCSVADKARTAVTDARTAVLLAHFYRAGDGDDASFAATIIISDTDLAPDLPGDQTLWVQGVGCGAANAHFNGAL